jgi:succinoglycan biosynthesis transport protein ExoP
LINARADTAQKRSKFEQVQKLLSGGGDIQTIPDILPSGLVSDLRARLTAITRTEAELKSRYGERHPDLVKIRTERRELEDQIRAEIEREIGNLKNELEVAESREASLAQSLAAVSDQSGVDNRVAVQLRELQRIASANKQIYESFLSRARIAEEETTLPATEARVISPANVPDSPSFPLKKLFAALGLVMGIGLGTGTAVLLELFRPGFVAQRQVEEVLELPVLASVPRVVEWEDRLDRPPPQLIEELLQRPFSRYTEAVRSLRFGVQMGSSTRESRSRVVQITSAMPGEGKTTLAVSLARSAAAAGELVLLIDADLRLGAATRVFGRGNALGLVDVLTSAADVLDGIHFDQRSGIHILPTGARAQNPPALLSSERVQVLIGYLRNTFDTIIIDSPPVAIAVDAAAIARLADQIVFAVKWSDTAREAVSQAIMQLRYPNQAVGIVLTMVDERKLPRHGRYLSLDSKLAEKNGYSGKEYMRFG